MNFQFLEEMQAEENARYDYMSELAKEHEDKYAHLENVPSWLTYVAVDRTDIDAFDFRVVLINPDDKLEFWHETKFRTFDEADKLAKRVAEAGGVRDLTKWTQEFEVINYFDVDCVNESHWVA